MAKLFLLRPDEGHLATAEALLTGPEREALARYTFPKRRKDWLLGRLAAKRALATAGGWAPEAVSVLATESGRPAFAAPDESLAGWTLSITHGHGHAAALVAPGPAGVDLERVRAVPQGGWRFFLTERERAWLADAPLGPAGEIVVWALKEAVYKALDGAVTGVIHLEVTSAGAGVARVDTPHGPFEGRYTTFDDFVLAVAAPEGAAWIDALSEFRV